MFDAVQWIKEHLEVGDAVSTVFLWDEQPTLSNYAQPGIYKPWNPCSAIHFRHRARLLDYASVMANKRVLDFGPGEGYPSLLLAPYVREVVGVEGSPRRCEECTRNAARIRVHNAHFVHVPPGQAVLPFPDESFDGVVASWSLEQSPNLREVLRELWRVLRSGGLLRFEPETLDRHHQCRREVWLPDAMGGFNGLTIFDRDIAGERVFHYGLLFDRTASDRVKPIVDAFAQQHGQIFPAEALTENFLASLRPFVARAGTWITEQPSFASWPKVLETAGFEKPRVTYSGAWVANRLFKMLDQKDRPQTLEAMDALLTPIVKVATEMDAPVPTQDESWLAVAAVKG